MDTDDEVRDRATFYVNILKEKEKALSSGYILNGWFIKVLTNQLEKIEFFYSKILGKMTNVSITIVAACIFNLHIEFLVVILRRGKKTGLSLRAGGRGFSPATKRVVPGYFHWKIEEK